MSPRKKGADIGLETVAYLYKRLKIDAEWATPIDRGFVWWSGPLAQRIFADPPFEDHGVAMARMHVQIDVLKGVGGTARDLDVLTAASSLAATAGWVRDPEDETRIRLASSMYIADDTREWVEDMLSWIAGIQLAQAYASGDAFDTLLRCEEAESEHPERGPRDDLDEMVDLVPAIVVPAGERSSEWAGPELLEVLEDLKQPPCLEAHGDEKQLEAHFAFGQGRAILRARTTEPHPELGEGLQLLLQLPADRASAPHPIELNEREIASLTRAPFVGSWCHGPKGPAFACFLPNALYRPGTALNWILYMVSRIRWVTEDVFGHSLAGAAPEAGEPSEPGRTH